MYWFNCNLYDDYLDSNKTTKPAYIQTDTISIIPTMSLYKNHLLGCVHVSAHKCASKNKGHSSLAYEQSGNNCQKCSQIIPWNDDLHVSQMYRSKVLETTYKRMNIPLFLLRNRQGTMQFLRF